MSEPAKMDLDAELVSALSGEPEAASEEATTDGAADEGQPEGEAEGNQPAETAPALEGQPDEAAKEQEDAVEVDVDITDLRDEKGSFDLKKVANLKKSYEHAQKLVGQTAKEREKLNKLPQLEDAAAKLGYLEELAALNPAILAEVDRAKQVKAGRASAPAQPAANKPEDVEKVVSESMAKGKYRDAVKAIIDSDPEIQELRRHKAELAELKRQEAEKAQQNEWRREREAWQSAYNGVIFDAKGKVIDQELYDKINNETLGQTATYEDATLLAMAKLGRSFNTKPSNTKAKAQASASPQGRAPARKPASEDDVEVMPGVTNSMLMQEYQKMR